MNTIKRTVAVTDLLLISPAALFMVALLIRSLQPLQYEPAHTAQQVIMWYAGRMWTLWVLLIALPLTVLMIGCAILLPSWKDALEVRQAERQTIAAVRADKATLFIAATTLAAVVFLAVVAVHMLMN